MQQYYRDNKEEFKKRNKLARKRKTEALIAHKSQPCMDCGENYPHYVMDLDHRPGTKKLFQPADAIQKSWRQFWEELAKCDVVCANCHRERTWQRSLEETL